MSEKYFKIEDQKQKRTTNGTISFYNPKNGTLSKTKKTRPSNILKIPFDNPDVADNISYIPIKRKRIIEIVDDITDDEFEELKNSIPKLIKKEVIIVSIMTATKQQAALVTDAVVFSNHNTYFQCPYCQKTLEREYQHYCDRCGQQLKWSSLRKIKYKHI